MRSALDIPISVTRPIPQPVDKSTIELVLQVFLQQLVFHFFVSHSNSENIFCALQEKFEAKNLQEKKEREAKQKKARFHFLSRAACKSNPHSNEGHLCADKPPHRHSSVRGAPCWGAWEGLGFDASIEQWATT